MLAAVRTNSDPIADADANVHTETVDMIHTDIPADESLVHSDSSTTSSPDALVVNKQLWAAEGIDLPTPPSVQELTATITNVHSVHSVHSAGHSAGHTTVDKTEDDDTKILHEGYLRKRYSSSHYMGSWRYCVVHGNRLRWFMTRELAAKNTQLRGEVWIKSVEPWDGHGAVNVYPNAFAIHTTSNRLLLCSAQSEDEKEQWVQSLTRAIHNERHRRLSRRIVRNGVDGRASLPQHLHHHAPDTAERRRIVPEDAVRAQALSDLHDLPSASTLASPHQPHPSSSIVSTVLDADSLQGVYNAECARCGTRFGTFLARRVVCHCCRVAFCSRHCNHYVKLPNTASARKCCLRCTRRQEFIVYLAGVAAFTASLATQLSGAAVGLLALVQQRSPPEDAVVYERTVAKLRHAPMSLTKTIKILYQTRTKPQLFCVACERLPFYVENCIDRVESLWYQILHLFQCCDTEFNSFSLQLFCLERYIAAICRRSPRIALQTIWHVQASIEDASRHHPNSLLLLLGVLYPPSSGCSIWPELLLGECADHQRTSILTSLTTINEQAEAVVALEPDSIIERWLKATTATEFQACALELESLGIQLIDYQSSIQYESLRVETGEEKAHLDDVVADQVRFVQSLAAISERLRHVQPVENRSIHLVEELEQLNASLISSAMYPLCTASDQLYKVLRVPPTDGKVFSTKMRAPTLIFIEAVPVDAANLVGTDTLAAFVSLRRGNQTFVESVSALIDETTQTRDSLSSSTESSTGTAGGTTPHHRRHGSQLSVPDNLENLSILADDELATPRGSQPPSMRQQQTCSVTGLDGGRSARSGTTLSLPASGFSMNGLTTAMSATKLTHPHHARMDNIVYDSKVYGESWEERRERIRRESPHGHLAGWQLFSLIVKTNDDLRQEMFTMQMLTKLQSIFQFEQLNLWLRTYRIVATGANIGLLETINDACSLDHLKKTFLGGSNLYAYFKATFGEPQTPSFELARRNFICSMAAYSIVSYVLLVKDRHNGNILLSADGHIIHIDFGFILGIAPGGVFSLEDAPFKLTEEMVEIMGGMHSAGFALYRKLMVDGFLAVQKYQSEIAALLQTTGQHSPFPCFEGAKLARVVSDLRARLCVGLTKHQVEKRVDHLIKKSSNTWGTRQYDAFQLRSNNIQP